MAFRGIHSLNADEAANVLIMGLGFDEVDFTEHLTNGATIAATKWDVTNDMKNADGDANVTITDNTETLAEFLGDGGELETPPELITPEANRIITEGQHNWARHGTDFSSYADTGGHIWTLAAAEGDYMSLAAEYAPMTPGVEYMLKVTCGATNWKAPWIFQDDSGNELFTITTKGTATERTFTAPAGTSGGLRVVAGASDSNCQFWDDFLLSPTASTVPAVGLVYRVLGTGDTKGDEHYTAKGDVAPAANDLFAITVLGGSADAIVYIGNAVGSYAWGDNQTSTLIQTAANRASAGLNAKGRNLKEYVLTYTIGEIVAPDGDFALTLETFSGESVTMPFTDGAQAVYFLSASDADAADFKIQGVSGDDTEGVFSISALTLFRCCDSGVNADDVAWWKIRAVRGAATFTGVALAGDNPASDELAEHQIREGIFSRITGTAGVIHAYRTAYRE